MVPFASMSTASSLPGGKDILDEEGYPTFEARPIDTKALIECQSYGQAVDLLGCFLSYSFVLVSLFATCS